MKSAFLSMFLTASEKRAFLLYYSVPLLMGRLPEEYLNHYNLLVGAIFRLLKSSITPVNLQQASLYLKLYCAQASGLYGKLHCNPSIF